MIKCIFCSLVDRPITKGLANKGQFTASPPPAPTEEFLF